MSTPEQFTLAIEHADEQRLDNFVPGHNGELLQLLTSVSPTFAGFWIFGEASSGRSHLLRGSCLQGEDSNQSTLFVSCTADQPNTENLLADLTRASQQGQIVAIDDVASIAGVTELEELLMATYQRLLASQGVLLVSHTQSAQALEFVTPDLTSRMRSLQHFKIQSLDDADKAELLRQRAKNRGYELSKSVLNYWLVRGPRALGALLADLDVLDQASLSQHQPVTIALLKRVLGY